MPVERLKYVGYVVGYQNAALPRSGYNHAAATFIPVSGDKDKMTLGNIKPNEDFISSKICFLTATGATAKSDLGGKKVASEFVYWFEADEPADGEGWYLAEDEETTQNMNSVELPFGDGFMVQRMGDEPDAAFVHAGQVCTEPITKGFPRSGYNARGNCSPVNLKLGDITVNEEFISSKICFFTETGATKKVDFGGKKVAAEYVYWFEADEPANGPGWYLAEDEETTVNQNGIDILAGEGFMVQRMGDEPDAEMTIPAAL